MLRLFQIGEDRLDPREEVRAGIRKRDGASGPSEEGRAQFALKLGYDTRNSWLGDVEVSPPCREAAQPRNAREEA